MCYSGLRLPTLLVIIDVKGLPEGPALGSFKSSSNLWLGLADAKEISSLAILIDVTATDSSQKFVGISRGAKSMRNLKF